MSRVIRRYRRGDQFAALRETMIEGPGPRYRWRYVLALISDQYQWMYTEFWRTNATRLADREIRSLGYCPVDSPAETGVNNQRRFGNQCTSSSNDTCSSHLRSPTG